MGDLAMNIPTTDSLSLQSQIIEIYKRFPSLFSYERVSVCSKIYYPISIIDILVEESIRQQFTPLELMVLELIKSGKNTIDELVHAIGLPELYIQGIVQDLENDNLIIDNKLTQSGEYGCEQRVKFSSTVYKRRLQFDPILHEVIAQREIDEKHFIPAQLTNSGLSHFLPKSHFSQQVLEKSFDVVQAKNMKVTGKRIKEVLSIKTYFVEAVAIQFNLIPHPFIFFPNEKGLCTELISISEANLNYTKDADEKRLTIDRSAYFEIWHNVKQIKDEMKKKQDNQLLVRDIKTKVTQYIEICNEEHTVITDSGLSIVLDIHDAFTFHKRNYNAIRSLEWTARHIPFVALEDEYDYSNFVAYSECYDRKVSELSKLIFELEQQCEDTDSLFRRINKQLLILKYEKVTISQLLDVLSEIQTEHKLANK